MDLSYANDEGTQINALKVLWCLFLSQQISARVVDTACKTEARAHIQREQWGIRAGCCKARPYQASKNMILLIGWCPAGVRVFTDISFAC